MTAPVDRVWTSSHSQLCGLGDSEPDAPGIGVPWAPRLAEFPSRIAFTVDYKAIGSLRHSICGPVEWSPNGNLRYGPEVRHENR
jgi:hypothetical protein